MSYEPRERDGCVQHPAPRSSRQQRAEGTGISQPQGQGLSLTKWVGWGGRMRNTESFLFFLGRAPRGWEGQPGVDPHPECGGMREGAILAQIP